MAQLRGKVPACGLPGLTEANCALNACWLPGSCDASSGLQCQWVPPPREFCPDRKFLPPPPVKMTEKERFDDRKGSSGSWDKPPPSPLPAVAETQASPSAVPTAVGGPAINFQSPASLGSNADSLGPIIGFIVSIGVISVMAIATVVNMLSRIFKFFENKIRKSVEAPPL
ncbi:hypothetical protein BDR26DRAFT_717388 [Obelidium mucronatum]|nr:hypothetical protein BDR26DRAFT_717388 [Obelidium mucronatum]